MLDVPTAGFIYTADDLTVTFSNQSTYAADYLWDFGDGITSTLENPVHAFAAAGTYTVTLTATGICGMDTVQQTLTVPPSYMIYLPIIAKNY